MLRVVLQVHILAQVHLVGDCLKDEAPLTPIWERKLDLAVEPAGAHQGRVEERGPPSQVFDMPTSERCRQFLASQL